jgi:hypothetical protein
MARREKFSILDLFIQIDQEDYFLDNFYAEGNIEDEDENLLFEFVEMTILDFDIEDGYGKQRVIYRRTHDNKFFEFTYLRFYDGSAFEEEGWIFSEVFPQEKLIIEYV